MLREVSLIVQPDGIKPTFGGHEKFVFRHGWLKKGVDALRDDPLVFTRDDALVTLGVGKNMVRSIRHWCLATGLAEEDKGAGLTRPLKPTELGKKMMVGRSWDPYLEDVGSLWLLHWQLTNNPVRCYVWNAIFSSYLEPEFTKKQIQVFLERKIEQAGVKTTSGTVDREVDCCLRTYVPSIRSKLGVISEETLDCPLAELDLIRYITEDNIYRFNIGPKPSLPVGIFGYALLTYLPSVISSRRTVAIDDCVYRHGSPGLVFKLDENSVIEHLEALEQTTAGGIRLQETAGLRQLYLQHSFVDNLPLSALELLRGHYGRK